MRGPGPSFGTSCNAGSVITPRCASRSIVTFTLSWRGASSGPLRNSSAISRLLIVSGVKSASLIGGASALLSVSSGAVAIALSGWFGCLIGYGYY